MPRTQRNSWQMLLVALAAMALMVGGCKSTPDEGGNKGRVEPTGPHAPLLKLLPGPGDVTDWKASSEAQVYGPTANPADGVEALQADLGPAADVFSGYGYVKSATRRYVRGQTGDMVTVRVFEMKGPQEAFGVFSVASAGAPVPDMGLTALAARAKGPMLACVKGAYYVTVEYGGTGSATPVLTEFGRSITGRITEKGFTPSLLGNFPPGAQPGEQYYLHTFKALTALPFFPAGDPAKVERFLGLGASTEVAVVGYPTARPGVLNYLFVINYPTDADAQAADKAYYEYLQASTNAAEKNIAMADRPVKSYIVGSLNAEENSVNDVLAKLIAHPGAVTARCGTWKRLPVAAGSVPAARLSGAFEPREMPVLWKTLAIIPSGLYTKSLCPAVLHVVSGFDVLKTGRKACPHTLRTGCSMPSRRSRRPCASALTRCTSVCRNRSGRLRPSRRGPLANRPPPHANSARASSTSSPARSPASNCRAPASSGAALRACGPTSTWSTTPTRTA